MWKYKKKYLLVIMVCLLVCSTLSGCGNKSLEEGLELLESGEYEAARNAFETALENKAEKTATIYNFLGNCEMQMGNAKAALNYYNIGMSLEGCSKELLQEMRFNEIAAYEQCGEWENAKAKLAEYTADYPEDTRVIE